jgi:hypothetical protein
MYRYHFNADLRAVSRRLDASSNAAVAQLAEHSIRNREVTGSMPVSSSTSPES